MKNFDFNQIIGHELVCDKLRHSISHNCTVSAYLFSGPEGIGKKTVANAFSAALLCEAPACGKACGSCPSCRLFAAESHPDLLSLSAPEDKKSIGVELVREKLVKEAFIRPFHSTRKVFIIENSELLTTEAQNALLKILEEPPGYAVFLLLSTAPGQLLETVLSRCLKLQLSPLPARLTASFFEALPGYSQEEKALAIAFSQGVIGKGLKILTDENYHKLYVETMAQLAALPKSGSAFIDFEQFLGQNKEQIHEVIDFLLMFFRDCLRKDLNPGAKLICADCETAIHSFRASCSMAAIVSMMEAVITFRERLLKNAGFTIAALELFTKIQEELHD